MRRIVTFLRRCRTELLGYSWRSCPVCGEMFGANERGRGYVTFQNRRSFFCCKDCDFYAGQIEAINNGRGWLPEHAAKLIV